MASQLFGSGSGPSTWVLLDDRPGNSTQSLGMAEALGWSYQAIELRFGPLAGLHPRLRGASRLGLDASSRRRLKAPWPDLVIAAGGRPAAVARWIRRQSAGNSRLVQLGRRGGAVAWHFDLVVTPRNARLWPHPNRIETTLPPNRIEAASLSEAAARWKPIFADAPRPRIALLVGGATSLYRFEAADARRLGELATQLVRRVGGSIFVTTSRRTGDAAARELAAALPEVHHFHHWNQPAHQNPYLGYLALADTLVVTGESESMLAEVCATDRPVLIHALPPVGPPTLRRRAGNWIVERAQRSLPARGRDPTRHRHGLDGVCAHLVAAGYVLPPRDLEALHRELIAIGRARRFGETPHEGTLEPLREVDAAARRIREMFAR